MNIMKLARIILLLSIIMVLFASISCLSGPAPTESAPPAPQEEAKPVVVEVEPVPEVFNPASISQEKYEIAKADVKALISDLNRIIRARNYEEWVKHLADSYFAVISSEPFLEERTEELFRRDQIVATNMGRNPRLVEKKVLRTARDYFTHVVVPARSNDWVDDIDFISDNRVKAYTLDSRGNRLVLYDLEIIDNKWKIIS